MEAAAPARSRGFARSVVLRAAQVALGVALVAYLLGSGQLELAALAGAVERWPWWLAAHVSMAGALAATTLRWHLLLRVHPIEMRLRDTGSLVLMGWCFNQITPGATGGDIAKGLTLASEHRQHWPAAVLSIVVDRALGVVTLMAMVAAAALVFRSVVQGAPVLQLFVLGALVGLAATAVVAMLALWLPVQRVLHSPRLRSLPGGARLAQAVEALWTYRRYPHSVLAAALCGVVLHVLNVVTSLLLACALFGAQAPLRVIATVAPMIHLAAGVPITPFGNAGVLEAAYAELLAQASIVDGALLGLLQRSVGWTYALAGAGVLVFRRFGASEQGGASDASAPSSTAS